MAATRPIRVSDLIAKYGWKIMPYLSNLGPTLLAEAQIFFVDSGHTNALDADDGYHGHSFVEPLATIDYAIDLCTAGERSVILVAPGHNESLAAATIDFDVSDITCIGIGEGTNKPRIDFDNAASSVVIGANNIHLINLTFMPAITDILIGVEIEAAVTGTILEKCDFAEGENAADEFILGMDIKAGCSNTKVTNCLFRTKAAAAGCTHAIKLTGASDNVIIEKSRMIGNWSTAAIGGDTTLSTDLLIDDVTIKVLDGEPGIEVLTGTTGIIRNACIESTGATIDNMIVADAMSWFNNFGVRADGEAAEIIGGGEVNAALIAHGLDHLVTLADGTDAYPASVVEDSILAKMLSKEEPPVKTSYNNTTHSMEAIGDDTDAIIEDIAGAVPDTPTANSLQDILSKADAANTFDNTTDSLEAIRDRVDLLDSQNQGVRTMAGVFYANANVGASGDGLSWATAVKTITEALVLADTRNDIIYVAPGDYDETATLAVTVQGLQIIGPGPDTQNKAMVYDGAAGGYDLMTINAHEVVIDGLAFSAAEDTFDGIVVGGSSASYKVTIRNCRFDGWSGEYGIQAGAGLDCPDILIENNLFRSWNTAAVQVNCTRSCVRNNIFHVVTDKIGLEHVPVGGDRPDNVYLDNTFSGIANSSTTGIKFTGAPSNGTIMTGRNMFFGTWNTSITTIAAYGGIENYVADDAGGALIDTVT